MPEPIPLQLEVTINSQPIHQIVAFFQLPDFRIAAKRRDLAEIGIKVPEGPEMVTEAGGGGGGGGVPEPQAAMYRAILSGKRCFP